MCPQTEYLSMMGTCTGLLIVISILLVQAQDTEVSLTCGSAWEEYSDATCTYQSDSLSMILRVSCTVGMTEYSTIQCTYVIDESICSGSDILHVIISGSEITLTIDHVNRSMTQVMCSVHFGGFSTWVSSSLQVFVRPQKPICLTPVYVSVEQLSQPTYILLLCHCPRIFPLGKCKFNIQGSLEHQMHEFTDTIYDQKLNVQSGLYSISCGFGIPLNSAQLYAVNTSDASRFQVQVYPDISDGQNFSAYSDWTAPFVFVPSRISSFSINNEAVTITVSRGDSIRYFCEALGNPLPTVAIFKKYDNTLLKNASNTSAVEFIKPNVDCQDEGTYICQVTIGTASSREIQLTVRGSVQFLHTSQNQLINIYHHYPTVRLSLHASLCPSAQLYLLQYHDGQSFVAAPSWDYSVIQTSLGSRIQVTVEHLDQLKVTWPTKFRLTVYNGVGQKAYLNFSVQYIDDTKPVTQPPDDDSSSTLPAGSIFGIGFSVVILVIGGIVTCFCVWRRKIRQRHTSDPIPSVGPGTYQPAQPHSTERWTQDSNNLHGANPTTTTYTPNAWRTTNTPSAPPRENDDDSIHCFLPPPSYETVMENSVNPGTTGEDFQLDVTASDREEPPPSYESGNITTGSALKHTMVTHDQEIRRSVPGLFETWTAKDPKPLTDLSQQCVHPQVRTDQVPVQIINTSV